MAEILDRVKMRLVNEDVSETLLEELVQTATDRICLRLRTTEVPKMIQSIGVEIVLKLYRKQYHEGISAETVDKLGTTFEEDVFAEYEAEFEAWIKGEEVKLKKRVVKFI